MLFSSIVTDKLREYVVEYQICLRLKKTSSASKNFCRVLDIRVTEVMEPHGSKAPVTPFPKHYSYPMEQPGQSPLYLLYCSDNSNNIIPIPLILFRNG